MTTETTTTFICDRCGRTAEGYQRDVDHVELSFGWVNLTRRGPGGEATADTMDLCPDCTEAFEAWRVAPATGGTDGS